MRVQYFHLLKPHTYPPGGGNHINKSIFRADDVKLTHLPTHPSLRDVILYFSM